MRNGPRNGGLQISVPNTSRKRFWAADMSADMRRVQLDDRLGRSKSRQGCICPSHWPGLNRGRAELSTRRRSPPLPSVRTCLSTGRCEGGRGVPEHGEARDPGYTPQGEQATPDRGASEGGAPSRVVVNARRRPRLMATHSAVIRSESWGNYE